MSLTLGTNISADIIGEAEVTDGDTIVINDIRIRFTGSDAPESYFLEKLKHAWMAKGVSGNAGMLQRKS